MALALCLSLNGSAIGGTERIWPAGLGALLGTASCLRRSPDPLDPSRGPGHQPHRWVAAPGPEYRREAAWLAITATLGVGLFAPAMWRLESRPPGARPPSP